MNVELLTRWKAGQPPFDGLIIATEEGIPLSSVRAILTKIVPFLSGQWPDGQLYTVHDWHAHDGGR